MLSLPAEPKMQGRSFARLLRGDGGGAGPDPERVALSDTSRHDSNLVGAMLGGRALILDLAIKGAAFYDLRADPGESRNLVNERVEDATELLGRLVSETRAVTADRWLIDWEGIVSARAGFHGMLLGEEDAAALKLDASLFSHLQAWQASKMSGRARLIAVPPDHSIEFSVVCDDGAGACAWLGDAPVGPGEGAAAGPGAAGGGLVRFLADPLAHGARLRARPPEEARSARTSFRVSIGSPHSAPSTTSLTPEEIERLRSPGYAH